MERLLSSYWYIIVTFTTELVKLHRHCQKTSCWIIILINNVNALIICNNQCYDYYNYKFPCTEEEWERVQHFSILHTTFSVASLYWFFREYHSSEVTSRSYLVYIFLNLKNLKNFAENIIVNSHMKCCIISYIYVVKKKRR